MVEDGAVICRSARYQKICAFILTGDEIPKQARLTGGVSDASRMGLAARDDACLQAEPGGPGVLHLEKQRSVDDSGAERPRERRQCKRDKTESEA